MDKILNTLLVLILFLSISCTANNNSSKKYKPYNSSFTGIDEYNAMQEQIKKAERGDITAQHNLGAIYFEGKQVKQNYTEAIKWFTMSAKQGYVSSQYNLGIMFSGGLGTPKNYKTAIKWYSEAGNKGDIQALYNLGMMFYKGLGTVKDYIKAYALISVTVSRTVDNPKFKASLEIIESTMTSEQIYKAQELALKISNTLP